MRVLKKELWPCRVKVNPEHAGNTTPVELCLGNQFGTYKGRWNVVHQSQDTYFYFRNQKDANWFALRWS